LIRIDESEQMRYGMQAERSRGMGDAAQHCEVAAGYKMCCCDIEANTANGIVCDGAAPVMSCVSSWKLGWPTHWAKFLARPVKKLSSTVTWKKRRREDLSLCGRKSLFQISKQIDCDRE
jgi:hypothetical protein